MTRDLHRSVDTRELAQALRSRDVTQRAVLAADALSWSAGGSTIEWSNGIGCLGSLSLSGYPTSASVYSPEDDQQTERSDWERAWLGGKRWCLTLRRTGLKWFDLQNGNNWSCPIDRIDSKSLEGFTPSSFVRLGRFEPRVDSRAIAHSEVLENPTAFLLEKLYRWWNEFLNDPGSPQDVTDAKGSFTKIVSAVLLIRTIEDIGESPFLPHGTLGNSVGSLRRNGKRDQLKSVFSVLADKFASRILNDLPKEYYPAPPLVRMVEDTYQMGVNFAHLDVDPVGQFYEQVLGISYERVEDRQPDLFTRGIKVRRDESARRTQGVYYTPRTYADTLARVTVRPLVRAAESLDEIPVICDVAAGSGELLCAALRQVLEVPTWRQPENVKKIIDGRLIAVDLNPAAVHLTALNLLRTAIRRVPELITDHLPLPSLEQNLICGNALSNKLRSRLPKADVCLLNPPFHGARKWEPAISRADQPGWLRSAHSQPNQAFAMLLTALSVTKPNGRVGTVFPSALLSGSQAADWREEVAKVFEVDAIVENYANAFEGVQSYAGLLWGRRRTSLSKTHTRVRHVRIDGAMRFHAVDFGALLARGGVSSLHVTDGVIDPVEAGSSEWLPRRGKLDLHIRSDGRVKIAELIMGTIHQAPVMAPRPWGRDLFLFDEVEGDRLRHRISGLQIRVDSSSLRRIAWPNYLAKTPILCEPIVDAVKVFLPGDGSSPIAMQDLAEEDPIGFDAASAIRMAVASSTAEAVPPSGKKFVELLRKEMVGFHTPKGYVDSSEPMVVASRATRSEAGRKRGVLWSAWVSADGSVVPVGGMWFRTQTIELAALIAAWMNTEALVNDLMVHSPARHLGTSEPTLGALLDVRVSDPRRESATSQLAEFVDALVEYRVTARQASDSTEAVGLKEYRTINKIAESLWKGR